MSKTAHPERIDSENLRRKLKLKKINERKRLEEKYPSAIEYLKNNSVDLDKIREYSSKLIGAGALASALLLSSPSDTKLLPNATHVVEKFRTHTNESFTVQQSYLTSTINSMLPKKPGPLTREEEKFLERLFKDILGIPAKAILEGEHLNTTYGKIGIEQHLRRYPADSLTNHGSKEVTEQGMAPGLGAWGYFAQTREGLTSELAKMEEYYVAVQTLYLPDWAKRFSYLRDWYRFRKVLVVNTKNAAAVVADIADAGPAAWTGRQFGGSPEVMLALGGEKFKEGTVVLFFVDDPENKIGLGPVDYSKINTHLITLNN